MSNLQAIQDLRSFLKASLVERDDLIDGMMIALLSGETMFILGTPGTAKSLGCTAIGRAIDGNVFNFLMSKTTVPEELYGPFAFSLLQQDRFKRITTDRLPEAHIAFLDEVFKGSSAILNTLLPVINERTFYNEGMKELPLLALFAASNEIPSSEELAAFYDRFVLKFQVGALKDNANFKHMFENDIDWSKLPKISLDQLKAVREEVRKMPLDASVTAKILELRHMVNEKEIFVSDRKWMQSKQVVRAAAYLSGNSKVEVEDLVVLEHVLWHVPDQIVDIKAAVRKLCNPVLEVVRRNVDQSSAFIAEYRKLGRKANNMEIFNKIQNSKHDLDDLYKDNPKPFIADAIKQVESMLVEVTQSLMRSSKS